jgi:hypothetical protein
MSSDKAQPVTAKILTSSGTAQVTVKVLMGSDMAWKKKLQQQYALIQHSK